MDIPVYVILGLIAGGYALNDKRQARPTPMIDESKRSQLNENKRSGAPNIYSSSYFDKVKEIEEEAAIRNYEASFDPINTNIIPYYFNNLNENPLVRVKNPGFDAKLFAKLKGQGQGQSPNQMLDKLEPRANDLTGLSGKDGLTGLSGKDGQGGKGGPSALFANPQFNANYAEVISTKSSEVESFDSGSTTLTHNNMVPFFGGTAKQSMADENRLIEGKLENFTGNMKLKRSVKTAQGALFAPVMQNLEQIAAPRDYDRFTNSLQIRNNELPFEQERVGRGLNDGYTSQPSGGFHSDVRILPKTIDDLLVNPKVVKDGRIIAGKAQNDKRTAEAKVYKYRPEVLVTNFSGERNFTTTGQQLKPTAHGKWIMKAQARAVSKAIQGTAGSTRGSKSTPTAMLAKVKASSKCSLKATPFRNLATSDAKRGLSATVKSTYENRANERDTTQPLYGKKSWANAKSRVANSQNYLTDTAKDTRHVITQHSQELRGNIGGGAERKGKVYDPAQVTKCTIKQQTGVNSHMGVMKPIGQDKGKVYNPNQVMKTTIKQQTGVNSHMGVMKPMGQQKGKVYDPNQVMKPTIKQQTENSNRIGNLKPITETKGKVYDPNQVAKTTIKQQTGGNQHTGHLQSINEKKSVVYDPTQVTKTTIQETTLGSGSGHYGMSGHSSTVKSIVYDPTQVTKTTIQETTLGSGSGHYGMTGQTSALKSVVYDPFEVAKPTIKESTLGTGDGHVGQVSSGDKQNGQGYQTAPVDLKNTSRQFLAKYYHPGGAGPADAPTQPPSHEAAHNMEQNISKEVVSKLRNPEGSSVKITAGVDTITMETKKLDKDRCVRYSAMRAPVFANSRQPTAGGDLTSVKNVTNEVNTQFDPIPLLEAYKRNPLTQSLSSWA
jgi:hypothetical protein